MAYTAAMDIENRVAVITGAASGIGKATAELFHSRGAAHVVVADRNESGAKEVAASIGGTGVGVDVADEAAVRAMIKDTEREHGRVDVVFSNAGYATVGGLEEGNEHLQKMYDVHVMAHVYACRAALPGMIERGEGYLLSTASAAGLLTQIGSIAYAVTKAAAVALAEWLAITHGPQGIRVSVLCPQAVATNIRQNSPDSARMGKSPGVASGDGVLTAADAARVVLETMQEERFWILTHPEVATYVERKALDVDRWLHGMQRFQGRLYEGQELPGQWFVNQDRLG